MSRDGEPAHRSTLGWRPTTTRDPARGRTHSDPGIRRSSLADRPHALTSRRIRRPYKADRSCTRHLRTGPDRCRAGLPSSAHRQPRSGGQSVPSLREPRPVHHQGGRRAGRQCPRHGTVVGGRAGPDGSDEIQGPVLGFVLSATGADRIYVSGDNASRDVVRAIVQRTGELPIAILNVDRRAARTDAYLAALIGEAQARPRGGPPLPRRQLGARHLA
jgi:hypothetical protein